MNAICHSLGTSPILGLDGVVTCEALLPKECILLLVLPF